jgi:hypothetical protein
MRHEIRDRKCSLVDGRQQVPTQHTPSHTPSLSSSWTRRGVLTFDDVIRFYLRKRKEFMASSQDYKLRVPVAPDELVKMRLHQEHDVPTECDMHSQPLLLFRILFFIAMQDSRGEVHLLTAFQASPHLLSSLTPPALLFCRISLSCLVAQRRSNSTASSSRTVSTSEMKIASRSVALFLI